MIMPKENNFISYIKSKRFWIRFLISFFILINLIMWLKNYSYFGDLYRLTGDFFASILTIYDWKNTFIGNSFLLIMITTVLSSVNIALLIEFVYLQKTLTIKKQVRKENIFISGAIALAVLASHCASCSIVLLGSFLSIGFMSWLPYGGEELGYVAIIILVITIYNLIKKINNPFVC
ncbi:MAG: hypothetical protein QG614_509 [Patescibacteria group bacterium]|nr:hypothetical protein [Patescibacteria group bacterium]